MNSHISISASQSRSPFFNSMMIFEFENKEGYQVFLQWAMNGDKNYTRLGAYQKKKLYIAFHNNKYELIIFRASQDEQGLDKVNKTLKINNQQSAKFNPRDIDNIIQCIIQEHSKMIFYYCYKC